MDFVSKVRLLQWGEAAHAMAMSALRVSSIKSPLSMSTMVAEPALI